jgi:hypothetical protein
VSCQLFPNACGQQVEQRNCSPCLSLLHVLPVLGYQENPGTFAMAEGTAESAQRRMRDLRDSCPPRSRHYFLWVLSCGGILLDGITLAALAISLPLIRQSFPMSAFMVGAVSSGAVVGMAIGAIFGGRVSDRIGRRRSFLFSMSLITVTATSSAFAWDPSVILLTQFLIGCGQGSEFPNSSAYVSEIMPTRVRNRMLVATITTQAVGMLVGVSLGYLLLQASPEVEAWRYFLGSRAAVGALLVVLRLLTMPESPIWLMHRGQNAEAAKVLASLRPDDEKELAKLGRFVGSLLAPVPPPDRVDSGSLVPDGHRQLWRWLLLSERVGKPRLGEWLERPNRGRICGNRRVFFARRLSAARLSSRAVAGSTRRGDSDAGDRVPRNGRGNGNPSRGGGRT